MMNNLEKEKEKGGRGSEIAEKQKKRAVDQKDLSG